ncbi:GNAT family N-acetyltransferase [Aerosakkonemataceae cyanobacterium BLCC-F50]|uniref:GNAT family N-acetyltransferase n=1 Tax=Floridaenema flaviceps BLCC-F50 TaxID=3153642 RepID=A0ABV4XTG2_9CYAN
MTNNEIIHLKAQQIPAASEVLAKAFENEPVFSYIFPKEDQKRMGKMKQIFISSLRYSQPFDSIYTTDALKGVAIWIPPGKYPMGLWHTVQFALTLPFKVGWGGIGRVISLSNKIEDCHQECMSEPHWYLNVLGVDPAYQGQGVGGKLIEPILKQADGENLPCYLETDSEKNVNFYQKRGFQVVKTFDLPESNLRLWGMQREPQG